ncbi:hypothetical protein [Lactovum miscens]|uniref:Isochorismate hydrolase n=1 Tax=Lactovum miscens TaxID=190387 RepID=A0A841C7S0_9LACT|nr:hypothetical protein [Lactovum miscens]MBB5887290.1 isochorismate hydrolase [Lactovum miscens]
MVSTLCYRDINTGIATACETFQRGLMPFTVPDVMTDFSGELHEVTVKYIFN